MILGKQSPISGQHPDVYSKLFSAMKTAEDSEVGWAKPVSRVEKFIKLYTGNRELIYDPFSGSGTTIIACQNLSRRCRAIEIDPGYVAVALERWANHTGQTPELITR
jgi:DNA modification methylase